MKAIHKTSTILDGVAATGAGQPINVAGLRHIVVSLATANSANGTVKFQGSIENDAPTFTSAQSVSNMWDFIEVIDLEDGSAIDGDTGIAPAGTDDFRLFRVNVDNLRWFNARVTAYVAGNFTVKIMAIEN